MRLNRFDHIVLCVADVDRTIAFYEEVLGMQPRQERPGCSGPGHRWFQSIRGTIWQ